MNTLLEWGPARLQDRLVGALADDPRDAKGERPDDN